MKKKRVLKYILVIFSFLLLTVPNNVFANEGDSEKSASVKTEGAITFESTTESIPPPTTEIPATTDEPTTSESLPATGGKLPKTGESNRYGMILSGTGVLFLALLLLFWKRKQRESAKGGTNG